MSLITLLHNFMMGLHNGQLPELGIWGYLLLALFVAVEGPIATLLGAAAASAGIMKPIPVFVAAAVGNLTADTLWYGLGYLGKIEWLFRFGGWVGVHRDHLERLKSTMMKHATKVLFFAKLTVSFMIPSLIAAGLVRAPWRRWFPAIFAGEMLWTGSLVLIGYYATEAIKRVEQGVEYAILVGSVFFLVAVFWLGRRMLREEDKEDFS